MNVSESCCVQGCSRTNGKQAGVNGIHTTQVGVLEERDEISLHGLLESTDRRGLEAKIALEVLSNLTNKSLEGELADQELRRLLVTTDLTKSDGTRLISMRLLDTTCFFFFFYIVSNVILGGSNRVDLR